MRREEGGYNGRRKERECRWSDVVNMKGERVREMKEKRAGRKENWKERERRRAKEYWNIIIALFHLVN